MSWQHQRERLAEYEQWMRSPRPAAALMRYLMGAQGQFLVNGPLLRLPDELGMEASLRVLDIGCGRASVVRFMDGRVGFEHAPVGLDFSRSALRHAQRDNASSGRPVALVQGSATALPIASGSFDLVLCGYLVKHLEDDGLRDLLDEIWRVLAPGGLALIWEFAPTGRRLLDAWNRIWVGRLDRSPRLRSGSTLLRFAQDAGFPFAIEAGLRPFLFPFVPRASILFGRPPDED